MCVCVYIVCAIRLATSSACEPIDNRPSTYLLFRPNFFSAAREKEKNEEEEKGDENVNAFALVFPNEIIATLRQLSPLPILSLCVFVVFFSYLKTSLLFDTPTSHPKKTKKKTSAFFVALRRAKSKPIRRRDLSLSLSLTLFCIRELCLVFC